MHLYIIDNAVVFGSLELISQCNNPLIPLNALVVCNAVILQLVYKKHLCCTAGFSVNAFLTHFYVLIFRLMLD